MHRLMLVWALAVLYGVAVRVVDIFFAGYFTGSTAYFYVVAMADNALQLAVWLPLSYWAMREITGHKRRPCGGG